MTYNEFLQSYQDRKKVEPTYRIGQHFINTFIVDSSSEYFQGLWNERQEKVAKYEICEYINKMQWDWNNLPVIKIV